MGSKGKRVFFPAICKKDPAESEGYKLEINPDQMLPVETWWRIMENKPNIDFLITFDIQIHCLSFTYNAT